MSSRVTKRSVAIDGICCYFIDIKCFCGSLNIYDVILFCSMELKLYVDGGCCHDGFLLEKTGEKGEASTFLHKKKKIF